VFGSPRDLKDTGIFHRLALIPFLAWVGLGADGLSSSSYGPEEAFKALGQHTFLAVGLVVLMATTVLLISGAYSRLIEEFPTGGGGYVVATKLLGERAGVISGSALLVDYVLTITTSIAAAGDAIFSLLPGLLPYKLGFEIASILFLVTINIRGVRESVLILLPVFLVFVATHVLLIGGGIIGHASELGSTVQHVGEGYRQGVSVLGMGGVLLVFLRAYSLGGGTYTGIEAVSNGLPIMREPRVQTGKRTMFYMAASLAFTASGLLLCYLLWHIAPQPGLTMNFLLVDRMAGALPAGHAFILLTMISEGLLLVVAAQTGFIDGPRVLANMAVDSWVPHRFAALSERLTTQNGIMLMGAAALAALLYTGGRVSHLIVMYSINVFLTFSLSMFAMLRYWFRHRRRPEWPRRALLFASGFVMCATILVITIFEKFGEGGWVTVVVTALLITLCFLIRGHYRQAKVVTDLSYAQLGDLPKTHADKAPMPLDPKQPTAAILVASYGGIGIHTMLNVNRSFPGFFKNFVFISVGVVDSGDFKGEHAVEELRHKTGEMLDHYVKLAQGLGVPAAARYAIGTDVVEEAEQLCLEVAREFSATTFFAGKMIFQKEQWWHRILHNETALALQQRLQWAGRTMVTMPVRVSAA
jgi:amino acid transporter